jgi:hypothetical protein
MHTNFLFHHAIFATLFKKKKRSFKEQKHQQLPQEA